MTKRKTATKEVVQQKQALELYFKNMLGDLLVGVNKPELAVQPTIKAKSATPPVKVKESSRPVVKPQDVIKTIAPAETKVHPLSVMPEWSQQAFQALFFKVDEMVLAVPLTELLRTIQFDRKVTKVPQQPGWFIGLMDELDSRIGVLDTGQLVFGKVKGSQRDLEQHPYQSILITGDGRWGLACDAVLSIGTLEPEKVRWRTYRKKRPWLIGTVIDELIAVIDIQKLVPHRSAAN